MCGCGKASKRRGQCKIATNCQSQVASPRAFANCKYVVLAINCDRPRRKNGGGPAGRGATTVEAEACRGIGERGREREGGNYLRCQWYGAISLSTLAGPHVPGSYGSTGGGDVSSGSETSQTRSMPSELVNSDMSPSIASRISRSYPSSALDWANESAYLRLMVDAPSGISGPGILAMKSMLIDPGSAKSMTISLVRPAGTSLRCAWNTRTALSWTPSVMTCREAFIDLPEPRYGGTPRRS